MSDYDSHAQVQQRNMEKNTDDKSKPNYWGKEQRNTAKYPLEKPDLIYLQNRKWKNWKGELENINDDEKLNLNPFTKLSFVAGKSKRIVGYFKGLVSVYKDENEKKLMLTKNDIFKDIKKPKNVFLRLYILTANLLRPADNDAFGRPGKADPYLIIKLGDVKISTRDRYIKNKMDPDFYEKFEIPIILPGPSKLIIEIWDHDGIFDDFMGKTVIDIEDRWYSEQWRSLNEANRIMEISTDGQEKIIKNNIPVEHRTLRLVEKSDNFHEQKENTSAQGQLKLWLELLTTVEKKLYPDMIDIKPPPATSHELRVIIWECSNVKESDETTHANDLFVTGGLVCSLSSDDKEQLQQTDTHFRTRTGNGSFNWRLKFPIKLP
eukprot:450480_1